MTHLKGPWRHNDFPGSKFFGNADKWDAILEKKRTLDQLEEIQAKIKELQAQEARLLDYVKVCDVPGSMMAFGRMVTKEQANAISRDINRFSKD